MSIPLWWLWCGCYCKNAIFVVVSYAMWKLCAYMFSHHLFLLILPGQKSQHWSKWNNGGDILRTLNFHNNENNNKTTKEKNTKDEHWLCYFAVFEQLPHIVYCLHTCCVDECFHACVWVYLCMLINCLLLDVCYCQLISVLKITAFASTCRRIITINIKYYFPLIFPK